MRSSFLVAAGSVAACLALVVACSDDSKPTIVPTADGGDAGGGAGDAGDAAPAALSGDAVAQAYCEKVAECTIFVDVAYGSTAGCVAKLSPQINRDLALPGATATQADIDRCALAVKGTACKDLLANRTPADCKKPGTLADGAVCGANGQCKSTSCQLAAEGGNCGTCGARRAAGANCVENDDCQDGLVCNRQKKCAPVPKDGEDCTQTDCENGLSCFDGKCTTALGEGATCSRVSESDACNLAGKGLICVTGTCTKITIAKQSQACGVVSGKLAVCEKNARCALNDGSADGTCDAPLEPGAACDDAAGKKCADPAKCVAGKCTLRDPTTCK